MPFAWVLTSRFLTAWLWWQTRLWKCKPNKPPTRYFWWLYFIRAIEALTKTVLHIINTLHVSHFYSTATSSTLFSIDVSLCYSFCSKKISNYLFWDYSDSSVLILIAYTQDGRGYFQGFIVLVALFKLLSRKGQCECLFTAL